MCENLWGTPTCSASLSVHSNSFPDLGVWSHCESQLKDLLKNMKTRAAHVSKSFSGEMWVTTFTTQGLQHATCVRDWGWGAQCQCREHASSPKVEFGNLYFFLFLRIFLKMVFIKAYPVVLHFNKVKWFCASLKENCSNIAGVQSGPEIFSKGHLILTKQTKHLVWELEKIQGNNNVLCMLQYISSSSWSPKRSYQPWVRKERKTLSKVNIAQSINFSIPSPQQGHKQLRVLIVGTLPLTYFTLIHNFFSNFLLWRGGVLWSNKTNFYFQTTLEINFFQSKYWCVFPFHPLISYGVTWSATFYLKLSTSVSYRKEYSQSLYVNIYSIKLGFMRKGLKSENENMWEMPSWSWRNKADNFHIKIFILIFMCS